MKTKEAIEFCESRKRLCDIEKDGSYMPNPFAENNGAQFIKIIFLLKQGEKYKKSHLELVEEIERRQGIINKLNKYKDMLYDNKYYSKTKKIEELERKYFSKGD